LDAFDYGHGYVNPGLQIHGQDINDQKTDRVRDFPNVAGSEIYLQGYRGPDVGIDDFEDQNVTDIMELASNVDEPIYASKKPKRVDMRRDRGSGQRNDRGDAPEVRQRAQPRRE